MRKFWKWKNKTVINQKTGQEQTERTLFLNGTIAEETWFDDDITPAIFKDELMSDGGRVTVWINSPGGDCVAAAQIYNMLKEYKDGVTVKIDGIAASAASVIAMAGDEVLMSPVSMLMIHNPATMAFGDSEDMQKAIDMLSGVKDSIINAYRLKTGLSRAHLSRLMDAETWMDANKALELGFADDILFHNAKKEEQKEDETGETEQDSPDEGQEENKPPFSPKKTNDTSMLFSRKAVARSLVNKLQKHQDAPETPPEGRSIDELYNRLNIIKHHI